MPDSLEQVCAGPKGLPSVFPNLAGLGLVGEGTDPGRVIARRSGAGPCLGIIREIGPDRPAVIGESLAKDIQRDRLTEIILEVDY